MNNIFLVISFSIESKKSRTTGRIYIRIIGYEIIIIGYEITIIGYVIYLRRKSSYVC